MNDRSADRSGSTVRLAAIDSGRQRRRPRRLAAASVLGTGAVLVAEVLAPSPAAAHGVGSRADLPLEPWLFAYAAAFALLISFAALRLLWPRPRLAAAATGRAVGDWAEPVRRVLGVVGSVLAFALFAASIVAAVAGVDDVRFNLAPTALYITFWVGMQIVSAVFGDVWRAVNPLWHLASIPDRIAGRDPATHTATGRWATHWPASVGLFAFLWLELAYFEPSALDAVLIFLGGYSVLVVAGGIAFGAGWVRIGDGFAVLFTLLAALAPLRRDDAGRLRLRWPGAGLADVDVRPGTVAVVLVVLGGTSFDGVQRTQFWDDVVGTRREWELTAVNTIGLVVTIAIVAGLYLVATHLIGTLTGDETPPARLADLWIPSLIPILLAYAIAHYYSLLVFEGQRFIAMLSDPLGDGDLDLFGTRDDIIDFTLVSPEHIAYVQVGAIVIGHVLGVVVAHDRAVERYPHRLAVRGQYPLLAMMVGLTVGGLLLLLNA